MKLVILDSGPIISLAINGLLHLFERLKNKFPKIEFVMTPQVHREVVEKGSSIKRYELEAIKVQTLIDKKIIKLSPEIVANQKVAKETQRILNLANTSLKAEGQFLKIVQEGEASCLAFSNLCEEENCIAIDERVTRLLTESPEDLKSIMEKKLHTKVLINQKNLKDFSNFKFIRSTELAYIAYKNNLLEYTKTKNLLEAVLYSLKYAGTSISSKEIDEIKNLGLSNEK